VAAGGARSRIGLLGDHDLEPGEPDSKLRGGWPKVAVSPTRLLEDGDRVRIAVEGVGVLEHDIYRSSG